MVADRSSVPTLSDLLDDPADEVGATADGSGETNLDLLLSRNMAPAEIVCATFVPGALGGRPGPWLIFDLRTGEMIPVSLGPRAVTALGERYGEVELRSEDETSFSTRDAEALQGWIRDAETLPVASRPDRLMDWIMERIEASRLCLAPVEAGVPGETLVVKLRGKTPEDLDAAHIPQQVLAYVCRNRQMLTSHDVHDAESVLRPTDTIRRQLIRSYIAVPVLFRGEVLAVCYADRFKHPRRFSLNEQTCFEAFAYQITLPFLRIRDERRRHEDESFRLATGGDGTRSSLATGSSLEPLLKQARQLAAHAELNLLVIGETGSGKEHLARFIHQESGRPGPFVPVNLSALPSALLESELMGSQRGAFTGAVDRVGWVEKAEGGTLFLDEIGELAMENQVKLLRFLEDKQVAAVGSTRSRTVDVRVIAATNQPVSSLLANQIFRQDLLHRFAPPLQVPPLRDRREEILPMAEAWLRHKAREKGLSVPELTDDARAFLGTHAWPGNIRQLQALVSHALLLARDGRIDGGLLDSLCLHEAAPAGSLPASWDGWQQQRDREERDWVRSILQRNQGKIDAAAREIGCPATTFRRLVKRHEPEADRD